MTEKESVKSCFVNPDALTCISILQASSGDTRKPNMIVDFCEKYLGKELSTTSNQFKDIENEKVIKAYANGIITGISSDKFAPNARIMAISGYVSTT